MWRKAYERLVSWQKDRSRRPLVVDGARQVGKSYLISEFGKREFKKLHSINFERDRGASRIFEEDYNPKRIIQELSFYLDRKIDLRRDLLFFDEIQSAPHALTSLKYFCEELPELALISAGSLLGLHLGDSAFPVGKVDLMTLYPMTFEEFLVAVDGEERVAAFRRIRLNAPPSSLVHDHLWSRLKEYFVVGGMPDAVRTFQEGGDDLYSAMERVRKRQNDLTLAYFADMAKHAGKQNAMHLERVLQSVVSQLGQSEEGSASKFRFQGVVPGISHYSRLAGAIDWLLAIGLLQKIRITNCGRPPLMGYTKENRFKLALFDVGMLGAMARLHPKAILEEDYGSYKGYFAENFVAQELVAAGRRELYAWQEREAEVEFLLDMEGAIIPVEVKSGRVVKAKSLTVFCSKYLPPYRLILSARPLESDQEGQIHRLPLYLTSRIDELFPPDQPSG